MPFLDSGCAELLTGAEGGWDADLAHCELPLEVVARQVHPSTHGPVDHLQVMCPRGHRYTHLPDLPPARLRPGHLDAA